MTRSTPQSLNPDCIVHWPVVLIYQERLPLVEFRDVEIVNSVSLPILQPLLPVAVESVMSAKREFLKGKMRRLCKYLISARSKQKGEAKCVLFD